MKKTFAATLAAAGLMALSFASPASADPTDVYPAPLNGAGSDTTEIVMKALDAAIPALGSWDVAGPVPWDTNGTAAGCSIGGRILGSTGGRQALANSVSNNDGCFQFARSSSRSTGQVPATVGLDYAGTGVASVPMLPITLGLDGLTYVYRAGSGTPRDLTLGQLRAIYSCTFTGVVDGRLMSGNTIPNQPLLPTNLSGSRADWLALMGLPAGADVASDGGTLPPCIEDGPGNTGVAGGEFAEHNGNVLTNGRQIILHSIPQYIAQGRASAGDTRALAVLGYIGGNVPLQMYDNPAGTLNASTVTGSPVVDGALFRSVYNVVPASQVNDPAITGVFGVRSGGTVAGSAGPGDVPTPDSGAICNNDAILISSGFVPVC